MRSWRAMPTKEIAIDVARPDQALRRAAPWSTISTMKVPKGEIYGFLGPERQRQDHDHPHAVRAADARRRRRAPASATTSAPQSRRDQARGRLHDAALRLYEDLTIRENLEFVARLYGCQTGAEAVERRIDAARASTAAPSSSPARCRAAGSSGWRWPPASCTSRNCSCSTSRRPASTPRRGANSGTRSTGSPRGLTVLVSHPLHGRGRALPPHRLYRLRQAAGARHRRGGDRRSRACDLRRHGRRPAPARRRCRMCEGVDMVAPFGADAACERHATAKRSSRRSPPAAKTDGAHAGSAAKPALEDVFIS